MNRLYFGDCLTIMQDMPLKGIDLIYLDPPFNSNHSYNAIYKDETGRPLPDQIEAFCDAWELNRERERAIKHMPVLMREAGVDDAIAEFWKIWMNALRNTQPRLLAYLSYMVERLIWMRGLLKPTGSLYYHCDDTTSHYMKVLLDGIMGHNNYRNELIWRRVLGGKSDAGQYGRNSDRILFYTRTDDFYFVPPRLKKMRQETIDKWYRKEDEIGRYVSRPLTAAGETFGDSGQVWRGKKPTGHWTVPRILARRYESDTGLKLEGSVRERLDILAENGYIDFSSNGLPSWRRYLHEATLPRVHDIWADDEVKPIARNARERMGYDTQKPLSLMDRIIKASCPPDGVVFDPFCGCGTTLESAQQLGRRWIGIDIAIHAIKRVTRIRLEERQGLVEGRDFTIDGVPRNVEGAEHLWGGDPYHFQRWAVEAVDGFVTSKKSADGGIDGRIYFEAGLPDLQSMVLEVKGGKNVGIKDLRALSNTLDYSGALMAGLIILAPLGKRKQQNFDKHMARAGDLEIDGVVYPRMQMLTVAEIFEGKRFKTPIVRGKREKKQMTLQMPDS